MVRSYRDLEAWKRATLLARDVYAATSMFPSEERFGLTAQMRRSAVSIASNIAEGHARATTREFLRFISISLGSLAKLETQMHIALLLKMGDIPSAGLLHIEADEIGKMLRSLQSSLRERLQNQ